MFLCNSLTDKTGKQLLIVYDSMMRNIDKTVIDSNNILAFSNIGYKAEASAFVQVAYNKYHFVYPIVILHNAGNSALKNIVQLYLIYQIFQNPDGSFNTSAKPDTVGDFNDAISSPISGSDYEYYFKIFRKDSSSYIILHESFYPKKGICLYHINSDAQLKDTVYFPFSPGTQQRLFAVTNKNKGIITKTTESSVYKLIDSLWIYYFNADFSLLSNPHLLFIDSINNAIYPDHYCSVSANDSFLYFLDIHNNEFASIVQLNLGNGKHQKIYFRNESPESGSDGYDEGYKLGLAPNGKIYLRYPVFMHTGSHNLSPYNYDVIEQPNRAGDACRLKQTAYACAISTPFYFLPFSSFPKATDPAYVYAEPLNADCKGVFLINKSDSNFKTFVWYWGDGDSSITKDTQQIVWHQYAKNGTYLYKVKGIVPEGYWAWYSDSITFFKADFYSKDSVGCQWLAQTFYDSSYQSNLYNQGTKWVWDFGDSSSAITYTPYVIHVFNKSGKYNVTMKIYYDYCVDSITKISVINILPAPKPGFTLDKIQAVLLRYSVSAIHLHN